MHDYSVEGPNLHLHLIHAEFTLNAEALQYVRCGAVGCSEAHFSGQRAILLLCCFFMDLMSVSLPLSASLLVCVCVSAGSTRPIWTQLIK